MQQISKRYHSVFGIGQSEADEFSRACSKKLRLPWICFSWCLGISDSAREDLGYSEKPGRENIVCLKEYINMVLKFLRPFHPISTEYWKIWRKAFPSFKFVR